MQAQQAGVDNTRPLLGRRFIRTRDDSIQRPYLAYPQLNILPFLLRPMQQNLEGAKT